ncbi:MAG TPA: hypothetical protein VFT54_02735, partial [Acidimicrobiia bacterium]|nr:hypothetical protein [Acidimicrobiia bacterium]
MRVGRHFLPLLPSRYDAGAANPGSDPAEGEVSASPAGGDGTAVHPSPPAEHGQNARCCFNDDQFEQALTR